MAYAVTHVLIAIIIISLYRHYIAKNKFSTWFVLIGGIAGLLPDIDLPLQWMSNALFGTVISLHRVITHSLIFVIIFLLMALLFYLQKKKKIVIGKKKISYEHIALFFTVIAVGWFTHIALDCSVAGDYNLTLLPGNPILFCHPPFSSDALLGLDAIILILWLIHEEWAKKIRDFF